MSYLNQRFFTEIQMIFSLVTILVYIILFHEYFTMKKIESFLIKHLTRICVGIAVFAIIFCIVIYFDVVSSQSWFKLNFSTAQATDKLSAGEQKIKITEFLRNIFLGLIPLIGLPFIAWQNKNAFRVKEIAEHNLEETQRNNRRTQENKMFIDCVNQLSSDKETIRTASIHGFHELLNSAQREIKSDNINKEDKEERIDFQDKILNILWSFMVEHSREIAYLIKKVAKIKETADYYDEEDEPRWEYGVSKDGYNQIASEEEVEYGFAYGFALDAKQETEKRLEKEFHKIHPQFRLIMEILAEFRNCNYDKKTEKKFWTTKSWEDVYLRGIDLSHANLEKGYFRNIDLNSANLNYTNFTNSSFRSVSLANTNMYETNFSNAEILIDLLEKYFDNSYLFGTTLYFHGISFRKFKKLKYNSQPYLNPDDGILYEPTKFPDNFNPEDHGMIDVSKQQNT